MTIHVLAVREGEDHLLSPSVEELPALLADPASTVWVDLDDNGVDEERLLSEVFSFRGLVVEDVFEESQPKIELHRSYLYLIFQGIDPKHREPYDVQLTEVDIFLGEGFVLTHHPGMNESVQHVRSQLVRDPDLLRQGPAFVAHAILDHVVDAYVPLMERFEKTVESIEMEIYRRPEPNVLERIMDLKGSLQRLRRVNIHQREILQRLRSPGIPLVPEAAHPFFGDIHDHFVRVADLADSLRDLTQGVLDTYMSVQSHRLNEVMKVLTVGASIMLPLTFLAGIWGMNFRVMPELEWKYGYAFAWGTMIAVAVTLLMYFKRRDWL